MKVLWKELVKWLVPIGLIVLLIWLLLKKLLNLDFGFAINPFGGGVTSLEDLHGLMKDSADTKQIKVKKVTGLRFEIPKGATIGKRTVETSRLYGNSDTAKTVVNDQNWIAPIDTVQAFPDGSLIVSTKRVCSLALDASTGKDDQLCETFFVALSPTQVKNFVKQ